MSKLSQLSKDQLLIPAGSLSSLALSDIVAQSESCLLLASLTLDSFTSVLYSEDPVPKFPDHAQLPTFTLVEPRSGLPMFQPSRPKITTGHELDDESLVTITAPTSPRLKYLISEGLHISHWAENVFPTEHEHIPWTEILETPPQAWVGEGSFYDHEVLKSKLSEARSTWRYHSDLVPGTPMIYISSPTPARTPGCYTVSPWASPNNLEALIFEREITLKAEDGSSERVSIHVPATTMTKDKADLMVHLRNLKTYFEDSIQDQDVIDAVYNHRADLDSPTPAKPAESLPKVRSGFGAPVGLAARRGKAIPSTLTLKKHGSLPTLDADTLYPGIPTPFLGSPSTYSPKFEHARTLR